MLFHFTMAYGMDYVALRYFNAVGAALEGSIGEYVGKINMETNASTRFILSERRETVEQKDNN